MVKSKEPAEDEVLRSVETSLKNHTWKDASTINSAFTPNSLENRYEKVTNFG